MRVFSKYPVALIALCFALACNREPAPVEYERPQVDFPMADDLIKAVVGEPVTFSARLTAGEKVSTIWYVDEVAESSSQSFSYIFQTPGIYKVRFEARNGSGVVQKTYTADVSDAFKVSLSVKDSTVVERRQFTTLKLAAIVEYGSNISHSWTIDGEALSEEAYFGTFQLDQIKDYNVEYYGYNAAGSLRHTFTVHMLERELTVSFSIPDPQISMYSGRYLDITTTALYGATGLTQEWTLDGSLISTDASLHYLVENPGTYALHYHGVNAKGETVDRDWALLVEYGGYVWDTFENIQDLKPWWTLGSNTPGIELVENPYKYGINTSDHCMRNSIAGTGSTSGYFEFKVVEILKAHKDLVSRIGEYKTIRFQVHMNGNNYCVFAQLNGKTQVAAKKQPVPNDWCTVEVTFPNAIGTDDTIIIRSMRTADGGSVSGYDQNTNNRIQYLDNFEFVD